MKILKRLLWLIILFCSSQVATGQSKNTENQHLAWYSYSLTWSLSKQYQLFINASERHFLPNMKQHQLLVHTQLRRMLPHGWNASACMGFFRQHANSAYEHNVISVPEIRPYLEAESRQELRRLTIKSRYRFEGRFFRNIANNTLEESFRFRNFRFRYMLEFKQTLLQHKPSRQPLLYLCLSNEVMLNAGKRIVVNVFDQNRLYAGVGLRAAHNLWFEVAYMNQFIQRTTVNNFYNRHTPRLTVIHNIGLRKKKTA